MQAITTVVGSFKVAHYPTIGLDIAKSVFQVHGVDADGRAGAQCRSRENTARRRPCYE